MGRNCVTVSKGVKDLWLLCGEEKGDMSRVARRGRASPQREKDLARPRVLRLGGGWAGPRRIHRASSTAEVNEFPANLWALESPD